MRRTILIVLAVLFAASGCGGSTPVSDHTGPTEQQTAPPAALFDAGATLGVLKSLAGAPKGISLTWQSVDDTDTSGPYITGYHVYKSADPIPDIARGESSYWVQFGGDTVVPQPAVPGDPVGPVDDLFAAEYGQTWYYRLTAIASDGDESRLSPEAQIDVSPFEITSVTPASLPVGDQFTIDGINFGDYDPSGDKVEVRGVEWQDGAGFVPVLLDAMVDPGQWTATSIVATLPLGATSGPVDLTIAGLTVTSTDILTNSDPYITGLDPLSASIKDTVTLQGANFGVDAGPTNFVSFGGVDLTDPADYAAYSDTEIQFNPPALGEYISYDVLVRAGGRDSNIGFCELLNLPPVAYLTVTPASGEAPLTTVLRPAELIPPSTWQYSYDPEGFITAYRYDFDGDGTDDFTTDTADDVNHTYADPGEYLANLTVEDIGGLTATAQFDVKVSGPPLVLTLLGGPSPGTYFADTSSINVRYDISGGTPPIQIDWYLIDAKNPTTEYLLATDTDLPPGTQFRDFALDTSTDVVTEGSGVIPRGSWQIRADGKDSDAFNDPDGSFSLPVDPTGQLGQLDVYRLNVGVISDDVADNDGTEGQNFVTLLEQMGYLVTYYPSSASLDPAQLSTHHAVVWASHIPFGINYPFEWLNVIDQLTIMLTEDSGTDVILFGVPAMSSAGGPVFDFSPFNDGYQPFSIVDQVSGPMSLLTEDYTISGAFGDHTVIGFDTGPILGSCFTASLNSGSVSQSSYTSGPDTFSVAASRANPTGTARLYFGMYIFSEATALLPPGTTPGELLDNIVTGTVF